MILVYLLTQTKTIEFIFNIFAQKRLSKMINIKIRALYLYLY